MISEKVKNQIQVVQGDITKPVSYTHLDVYKRQVECSALPECKAGERVQGRFILSAPASGSRVGLYADGIALQAEMDEDGSELTVLGESGSFRARTHRLQQRLSASPVSYTHLGHRIDGLRRLRHPRQHPRIQYSAGLVPCGRRRRYGTDQSADMDTG